MKSLITTLLVFLISLSAAAQEYHFFGPNDRPLPSQNGAVRVKVVQRKKSGTIKVENRVKKGDKWQVSTREKYSLQADLSYRVKASDRPSYELALEEVAQGSYNFTETAPDGYRRSGTSSTLPPLHLEGEAEEYYAGGQLKSRSLYRDNQLISNENWQTDGSKYIDNIFYSVDTDPEFSMGDSYFNNYILARMHESGYDFSTVEDRMVFGWVIMEDGTLDGVVALKGRSKQLRRFFVDLFSEMPGDWAPGILDDKPVRTFMTIPINISSPTADFQELDFTNNQMNFTKY